MNARNANLPGPDCVVKVGAGRGFIIEYRVKRQKLPQLKLLGLRQRKFIERRLIVTAAHCLPNLPPPHRASFTEERTFAKLLASLDRKEKDIWAECLFVDPVADIAVLGCPDEQGLSDEADAYHALTDVRPVVQVANARSGLGWVLSLDCHWVRTNVELCSGIWGASLTIDRTKGGMSGSPILDDAGQAIGIVAVGGGEREDLQPILTRSLPGWLLQNRKVAQRTAH